MPGSPIAACCADGGGVVPAAAAGAAALLAGASAARLPSLAGASLAAASGFAGSWALTRPIPPDASHTRTPLSRLKRNHALSVLSPGREGKSCRIEEVSTDRYRPSRSVSFTIGRKSRTESRNSALNDCTPRAGTAASPTAV